MKSRSSISGIRKDAHSGFEPVLRTYEALMDDEFVQLSIRVYGVGTVKELKEKIVQHKPCMKDFLRGFLAAAVTFWVFDERRVSVQRDLFHTSANFRAFEREIKQGMPH